MDLGLVELKTHTNKKIQKIITDFELGFIDLNKAKKNFQKQIQNENIKQDVISILKDNINIVTVIESKYTMANLEEIKKSKTKYLEIIDILNNMEIKKINKKFGFF